MMKRLLFLSTLLIAFCFHVQAWDSGANRENKGKQSNWKWRIYTPNWGGSPPWGASQIHYVYDAGGGRSLYGNVDLPMDLWDIVVVDALGRSQYAWRGYPYTHLGGGLFKDTGITGITGMNYTYTNPVTGQTWQPFNIQFIGERCFQNSAIQGEVLNYTPPSVNDIRSYAFAQCRSLSGNLVTPQNVTVIHDGTYQDCTGITGNCHVQDVVTAIGGEAFARNENMAGWLHLSNNLQSIGAKAFNSCRKLTGNLYVPNSVNSMGIAVFENCTNLNGWLDYADNMTTVPDYTFHNCNNLHGSIVLPPKVATVGHYAFQSDYNFDGQLYLQGNVWFIGAHAFEHCHRLNGNLDLHTVTRLSEYSFNDCPGFNGQLILSGSLENVPTFCFNNCYHLSGTLNIPRADFIGANAFQNCSGFTALSLPNTLQHIDNDAFHGCFNMRGDLHIPASVWIGDRAFRDCRGFNGRLYLPNNLTDIRYAAFWECNNLSGDLVFPASLQKIGQEAFVNCYHLTGNVRIPAAVREIGYHTFWQCMDLESFTFDSGSQLTTIGEGAWANCYSLKYIDMLGCQPLTASVISRNVTGSPFTLAYPYTLVYLPNGTNKSKIRQGDVNFVVDGQCDNFVVYDTHEKYKGNRGCDYEIKHQFTATKANYTRTFSGADAATLFLPYPTTLPTGMVAYELKRMKRANGESYFVFAPLPTSATLDANKPYVVRVTDGGSHNLPEMHNVVVPVTPALSATGVISPLDTDWMINGTTQFIPNTTAAGMKAYNLNVGNTWLPVTTANPNGYIHSFRAFLTSPTGKAAAKSFIMVLEEGPVVTDINSVRKGEADVRNGRYPFYSLDGKNLGRDYNRLPSGNIYIVNGKKFYKN
ncbi:leucine-rich repeat domain-containing protein [Hoylesella marshii]|nr:leucine-rich repeat domain-containing protein [Hoylesella marshii]